MAAKSAQPFHRHVQELRRRLAVVAVFVFIGGITAYVFRVRLIEWFSAPLHQNLYYTSPSGALQFTFQVCMLAGIVTALPIAVYEIVRFVQPAFDKSSKNLKLSRFRAMRFILVSYVLALSGAAFAYYFVLPTALHFFAGFSSDQVKSFITADKYFSFVANCVGIFAAIFQLPIIMLFINRIRPIPPSKLRSYRKWVIVGSFLLALILPFAYDPISQVMMALPLIVLYEISIILIVLSNKRRKIAIKISNKIARSEKIKIQTEADEPSSAPNTKPILQQTANFTDNELTNLSVNSVNRQEPRVKDWQFIYYSRPSPQPTKRWPVANAASSMKIIKPLIDDSMAL
jgi:sec-independent protein translocase protein TatC